MITSTTNQLIKLAVSLQQKKGRLEHQLYLAEGIHLVGEALKAQAEIRQYFWSQRLLKSLEGRELVQQLTGQAQGAEVSEPVLAKICETETNQGIVALVALPRQSELNLAGLQLGLILDGLQDPGNVGTIIRTAWAGGLDGLFFTPNTADPFQGKVVRATMGGVFHQRLDRNLAPETIAAVARKAGVQIIAGALDATCCCYEVDLTRPSLLLLGNEGKGVSPEWDGLVAQKVLIPQPGNAESLNVAVSAGILVYEAIRQRRTGASRTSVSGME